ncbi:MAG TPA: hypothetical protein VKQ72_22720 [Aggregatilineales bacterium]|nr:hypothetical protein [Aggregatilineales bacterium]
MFTFDSSRHNKDQWLEDLLAAQADALIGEIEEFDPRLPSKGISPAQAGEANALLTLASHVAQNLAPIEPSAAFLDRLHDELTGNEVVTLLVRWRKLPARYRLAARLGGLTITAGLALIAAKRGINVVSSLQRREEGKADSALALKSPTSA